MESLTRNNYEIWFVDYLDGRLSDAQLELFLDFLEANSDLKTELLGVSGISLAPGEETLSNKEMLLRSDSDIPGISQVDQLCIARMENDLTETEARQFDARLVEDKALNANYEAFKLTRLDPQEKIIFENKSQLLRKTRLISPWIITAVSAAALLVLALLLWPTEEKSAVGSRQLADNSRQSAVGTGQSEVTSTPAKEVVIPAQAGTPSQTANLAQRVVIPAQAGTPSLTAALRNINLREIHQVNSLTLKSAPAGPRIPDPQSTRVLYAYQSEPAGKNIQGPEKTLTLPQFALQLFREKVLGQDLIQVKRTRFTFWEVAGAGVNKINLLAGTKMKLNRAYNSKGDLLAVSFNSRLLDVEAPVRGQSAK